MADPEQDERPADSFDIAANVVDHAAGALRHALGQSLAMWAQEREAAIAQARLDGLRKGFDAGVGLEWNHIIGGKTIWRFDRPSEYDESDLEDAFNALVSRQALKP